MIMRLRALGWEVAVTLDVSRKLNDKTVFVFRQAPPETQPFAVLSFHQTNKLRFMSSTEKGLELSEGIERILDGAEYTKPPSSYWRARQWKLRGTPFSGRGLGSDQRLMIHLLTR